MPDFDLSQYLLEKPAIALVGASANPAKYGSVILQDLLEKNFTVYPVNPKEKNIGEINVWNNLSSLVKEKSIGLVVFVVPPPVTLKMLGEALSLGLKKVWVQPGAGDQAVREFLEKNNFDYLMDACVMVKSRVR
ncbi:MAG: CoA-binding protein [Bacteroidetes bacterium]|nr:CoA-binding protein [Bacteroidota bacterium]